MKECYFFFFIAQNAAWFVFLFLFVALVIYIIRLVIYLKRRKKEAIRSAIEREDDTVESLKEPKIM